MKNSLKLLAALLAGLILIAPLTACSNDSWLGDDEYEEDDDRDDDDDDDEKGPASPAPDKDIQLVTHPDFQLFDGFIVPVEQKSTAPDGFIPLTTAEEFDKIRLNLSANYILMADIDLSTISWEPVKNTFSGTLDGNGYTVKGVTTVLFDEVENGTICNLAVRGDIIDPSADQHNGDYDASIAGTMSESSLNNCNFDGTIVNDLSTGGLVRSFYHGTIENCYNLANVTGKDAVAGIAAYAGGDYCVIRNCFNRGNITGVDYVAGIVARYHSTGNFAFCYNTGTIEAIPTNDYPISIHYGTSIACGIVSYLQIDESDQMSINCCYNGGTIKGGDLAFGIALAWGTSALRTYVANCYNYGEFTLEKNSYGIAGCSSGNGFIESVSIVNCYNVAKTGRAGISNNSKNLTNCYFVDAHASATPDGALFADVHRLSEADMKKQDSFRWDYTTLWQMGKGDYPYPVFQMKNMYDGIA